MQQDEKIFADGFSFKRSENAPDFVIGRLSMKVDDAIAFMRQHDKKGWVNLNIKTARSGNHYVELDTFEPKGSQGNDSGSSSGSKPKPSKPKVKEALESDDDGGLPF
jgi:hypothetical protein